MSEPKSRELTQIADLITILKAYQGKFESLDKKYRKLVIEEQKRDAKRGQPISYPNQVQIRWMSEARILKDELKGVLRAQIDGM